MGTWVKGEPLLETQLEIRGEALLSQIEGCPARADGLEIVGVVLLRLEELVAQFLRPIRGTLVLGRSVNVGDE